MTPAEWIAAFAAFANVAPEVVKAFTVAHPALGEPPKADEQRERRDDFLDRIADKFPSEP